MELSQLTCLIISYLINWCTHGIDELHLHLWELVNQFPVHNSLYMHLDSLKLKSYVWFDVEFLSLEIALFKKLVGDQFR